MRSYKNKDGEQITVSQEHLDTAIRIKVELQNASASRRASWTQLVKLMEVEGFYDADNSEAYRCMIKAHQKSLGELPELPKHVDMVSDNKLKSIKSLVGEMSYEKRENQQYLREINKGKRELIDFAIAVEEIGNAMREHDFSEYNIEKQPLLPSGEKKMIVGLSDLHIGALVDTEINKFDFNVALARMSVYASRIITEARDNDVTDLYVMNLGDTVEHASMRFSQGFNAEFTFSEQIVKASDLLIKFMMYLSREGFNITYAGIAGNHDRITDKDKNIDGDHAMRPINEIIKVFIRHAGIENIKFEEAKDYGHNVEINTRNFKFVHGDLDALKDETLVAKHTSMDGIDYDMVVMGHYHHFREVEVGFDKRIVCFGSLKGADEYSENRLRKLSVASQGIIIVDENGEIDVKRIKLS